MTQSLEIIAPRLLSTQVGVDTHIARRPRQRLSLPVGDMLLRFGVSVLLGHSEVDDMDDIGRLGGGAADKEVVGLDIAIDQILLVDGLDAGKHLLGDHGDRLDGEATIAVVEEVLQTGAEQVNDQDVVQAFLAKVVDIWDASFCKSGKFSRYSV